MKKKRDIEKEFERLDDRNSFNPSEEGFKLGLAWVLDREEEFE